MVVAGLTGRLTFEQVARGLEVELCDHRLEE